MVDKIKKSDRVSSYNPSKEVLDITVKVRDAYEVGLNILSRPWLELNNRSVLEDENRGKRLFNSYVDTSNDDPRTAWEYKGTVGTARKKGVAMQAQLGSMLILPTFLAQNDKDETDLVMSEVMRDITEWMAHPTNSNYSSSYMSIIMGVMSNPVTFLGADFYKVFQNIKEIKNGKVSYKEILDEILSGFKADIWSASQILISNAYERNIQRQTSIIKRRYIEYSEAKAIYGDKESFKYVQKGVRSVYNEEDGLFYDIKDNEHENLVAEEVYLNRREDLEIIFLNGIYCGEKNVDANIIRHRDNNNAPKYNIVPYGYNRIGEHFFYYKSMMNVVGWDDILIDSMNNIGMNRLILDAKPPVAVYGVKDFNSRVVFPDSVVTLKDKNAKIENLLPTANISNLFAGIDRLKESVDDSTINDTKSGNLPDPDQKAYNVSQANQNAEKIIRSNISAFVESSVQFGDLMKDIAITKLTVPEVEELVGGKMKLKYKQLFLQKAADKPDKVINFDENLIGKSMSDKEKKYKEVGMLEESGYKFGKEEKTVISLNPEMFRKFKFYCKIDIDEMVSKNDEYWQNILPGLRSQLVGDPNIDIKEIDRKLLYAFFKSDADKMMLDEPDQEIEKQLNTPKVETKQNNLSKNL